MIEVPAGKTKKERRNKHQILGISSCGKVDTWKTWKPIIITALQSKKSWIQPLKKNKTKKEERLLHFGKV